MIRFLALVFLSWSTFAASIDWQGHRGARGLYPENTIGAMEEALKYPVTTLELDVVVSKDKRVVVSHEPWMNEEVCLDSKGQRFKGKIHNIYKMNFDEVVKFDCGSLLYARFPQQKKVSVGKPELVTLISVTENLLTKLKRQNTHYNIEIKSTVEDERDGFQPDYKSFSDLVVKTIQGKLKNDRFTLQCFDWRVLQYIHEKYPEIQLSALIEEEFIPQESLKKLGFNPAIFSPYFINLKPSDVEFFHSQKIKVIPWTVNEVKDMESLIKMKVDGIITDYPNLISEVFLKECGKGKHLFEGKCIKLPAHSVPSANIPGWDCKEGYVQKRLSCVKIKIPPHAILTSDGKNWECKPGFERYRGTCKKSSK